MDIYATLYSYQDNNFVYTDYNFYTMDYNIASYAPLPVKSSYATWWFQPLWKILKSVGMLKFPIYGKS